MNARFITNSSIDELRTTPIDRCERAAYPEMFGGDQEELEGRRRARVEAENDLRKNLLFGPLCYENGCILGAIDRNGRRHRGRRHFSEKACFRRRLLEMPPGMAGYIMGKNMRERGDKAKDEENARCFAELKTVPDRFS
ncbi:MAG: hypothetical protein WD407_02865 [Rhodospirillales bacterium]